MWDSMMGWGWGWGWHGGALLGVMHLLWWALIVAAIVALVRLIAGGGRARWPGPDPAIQILRERYARGEIDKAEFDQRKRDLGG